MQEVLFEGLPQEQVALCEEIVRRAAQKKLPMRRRKQILGFGRERGFYMFWFCRGEKGISFYVRKTYTGRFGENIAAYALCTESKEEIFDAIEAICRAREAYRSALGGGAPTDAERWRTVTERALQISEMTLRDGALAEELARLVDAQLSFLCHTVCSAQSAEIWEKYMLTDQFTLEELGREREVTRERIRQIVAKGSVRMEKRYRRLCAAEEAGECMDRNRQILSLLEQSGDAVLSLLRESLGKWGKRKRKFALQLLFGEVTAERLLMVLSAYDPTKKEISKPVQKAAEPTWSEQICYPTEVFADTKKEITAFPLKKEYAHVAQFRKKLEKSGFRFVQNPNIIYYYSTKTDHRPDFLLETENGRRVLILVVPTLNLAFSYNHTRFRALHEFCKENGYGYLITDGRRQTPWGLNRLELDPDLRQALDGILREKRHIIWEDICTLKEEREITNEMIAAYVLQNKLYFVMDPFFYIAIPEGKTLK